MLDIDDIDPARRAGIVAVDDYSVRFRHPLIRSAVAQSASVPERRAVHEALATALSAHPDRRVWHRAALISGEHEAVATDLEATAARARARGAVSVAATALQRSAELSDPAHKIRRLLTAATVAFEIGQPDAARPLLNEVQRLDRARRALRATGESSRRRDSQDRDQLTAQELQIAQLAPQGPSNRVIGQRLYLSHRTVSTHLHRVFPKLGSIEIARAPGRG